MADDLSFSPVGYEPMQAEWWPVVAAHLPKPWPREAALMDLRWWRGQELATRKLRMKRLATMPGRPTLIDRWGWTDWEVKKLLRSEAEWSDPDRECDPAPAAGSIRRPLPEGEPASVPPAVRQQPASETPRARVLTDSPINATPTNGLILSATADPVHSPPEKRKPARKAKTGKEPHPFADRVYKAWDRVWEKRMGEGNAYPWNYPVERAILTKCVADPYVSRDPDKGTEHMQLVGAAMTRYLSQEVDGRFVKGLSIKGFAGDVAKWFTPADTAVQIRRGPPEYRSISELLGEAEQPPTANRDAIDVAYRVVP